MSSRVLSDGDVLSLLAVAACLASGILNIFLACERLAMMRSSVAQVNQFRFTTIGSSEELLQDA